MLTRFRHLFRYNSWANREALRSVVASGAAERLLAHVAAAERLWLARVRQEPAPVPVWPDFDAGRLSDEIDEASGAWQAWLASGDEEELEREVHYENSKGERFTSRAEDILLHVLLHSAYHRGQLAADVRRAGGEPAYTDYIHAVRTGVLRT